MIGPVRLIWPRRIRFDGKRERENGANARVITFIAGPNINPQDRYAHLFAEMQGAIRLGDAIRHKYDKIDYSILWRATRNDLPQLIQKLRSCWSVPSD